MKKIFCDQGWWPAAEICVPDASAETAARHLAETDFQTWRAGWDQEGNTVINLLSATVAQHIQQSQARPEVEAFHKLWYEVCGLTWMATRWLGVRVCKNPLDLWVMQDLITDLRPTLIVETGTWYGGSALFYATIASLLGTKTEIVSVDIEPMPRQFTHPACTFLTGSSLDPALVAQITEKAQATEGHVLVVLDSDHSPEHVARELEVYAPLVTQGSYCIVEDTNAGGRPIEHTAAPRGGPYAAVQTFLQTELGKAFLQDPLCEHYLITMHPGGWLRRVG